MNLKEFELLQHISVLLLATSLIRRVPSAAPAGVGLMVFESHVGPPVAAFPLPAFAPTDLDDADMRPPNVATPAGFRGCHYIMAAGRELWHKAYRCLFGPSWHDAWEPQY